MVSEMQHRNGRIICEMSILLSGTNFRVPKEGELMVPNGQNRTNDKRA
jgi:hypothetical protein